jgi:ABC-type sulfate transport system permease subunit
MQSQGVEAEHAALRSGERLAPLGHVTYRTAGPLHGIVLCNARAMGDLALPWSAAIGAA